MGGQPTFRRTRVPPAALFEHLAEGYDVEEIVEFFPALDEANRRVAILEADRLLAANASVATGDE